MMLQFTSKTFPRPEITIQSSPSSKVMLGKFFLFCFYFSALFLFCRAPRVFLCCIFQVPVNMRVA